MPLLLVTTLLRFINGKCDLNDKRVCNYFYVTNSFLFYNSYVATCNNVS